MSEKQQKRQNNLTSKVCGDGDTAGATMRGVESQSAAYEHEDLASTANMMEEILDGENLKQAVKRVMQNKGAAGIDGMAVQGLQPFLAANWKTIKQDLLNGTYVPKAVRRVEIPKANGGMRQLGIPSVVDRFIQQAMQQTMQKYLDTRFSQFSYGFRPGKSQHQAVEQAQKYVCSGLTFVVDMDLEKFFDTVNHDVLMGRISKRISDKRVLKLIRAFLNSGMMADGLTQPTEEGVPQGGPLSPLLSNVILDELDKELEKRKLQFVRYADDCNIYVASERSGERVMQSITKFLAKKLKLKVNEAKSAVGRPWERKFLGFTYTFEAQPRRKIAPAALERLKAKLKEMTSRKRGSTLEQIIAELRRYLNGWLNYFGFCQTPSALREIGAWLRHRVRCLIWTRWKSSRTRYRKLREMGLSDLSAREGAGSGTRGPWRMSNSPPMMQAFPIKYLRELGLPDLKNAVNA